MAEFNKLVLVSLDSPHLRTFYELIKPLFNEVLLISDKLQDYCKTEIIDFRISKPLSAYKNSAKLKEIITQFQPSIVHVHQANSVALLTGKALKRKFPLVVTTWGSDVLVLPKQNWIKKKIAQKALSYANTVTADASFMEKAIVDLAPFSKVVIANFGIELSEGLNTDEINQKQDVIYSNRLHYSLYNIHLIIEGFAEFIKTHPTWKLIIAGRGDLTDDLKELAKKQLPVESYEFVGFIKKEQNYQYYKTSKIWISIPESDGTAVSLLEAMHFGCIPVVSDLPANNEWISSHTHSQNGIIVKTSVSAALTEASHLNSNEVYSINEDIIQSKASVESMRILYTKLYNDLIENFRY